MILKPVDGQKKNSRARQHLLEIRRFHVRRSLKTFFRKPTFEGQRALKKKKSFMKKNLKILPSKVKRF